MNEGAGEPTREDIERDHPGWDIERGTSGLWYATRRDGPRVMVRGEDLMDLRDEIRRAEAR